MNTKLVSSIGDVARSRLVIVGVDALLMDIAKLLADTQISLVVVCGPDGAMAGVITKTNIVRLIGGCCGNACRTRAADVMTQEVTSCHPTDCLPDVLSMMQQRGFVHIPVVDENYTPVGVINARDALRALMAEEEYEGTLLRDYVMGIGYH
ncbi:CBS domain-containing protein [Aromatoleum anaerobium]|uniref:CBS domain-containing protein n=1 Tax=Aromatoleum anaerobium TaxID=182180 RepID=A0ABX1PRD6_9RHOO|nr:CBS domain-containing protein [Aromatoleum anaerobium]MCK0505308.1 CBS domain-containing protein [Aromatoleum anaerobium]